MPRDWVTRTLSLQAAALLTLMGITSSCASEKREDPAPLKLAIEALNARFSEAFSHRDPAAIGQLYAEDAQALPPGAAPVAGRIAIQELWKEVLGSPVARVQLETVEVDGNPSTAWETGRYTLIAKDGSTMDAGKYIVVWKHDDAGWKIYRDMWSSNSPPQAPAPGGPSAERPAKR